MFRFVRSSVRPLALCLLLLPLFATSAGAILPPWDFIPGLTQPLALGPGETDAQTFSIVRNTSTCAFCTGNPPPGATCCTTNIFVSLDDVPAGVIGCISTPGGCVTTPVAGDTPLVVLSAGNNFVPGDYTVRVEGHANDGPNPRSQAESLPLHLFPFSLQAPLGTQIAPGQSVAIPVTLIRMQGFTAPITATVLGGGSQDFTAQLNTDAGGDLEEVVVDTEGDAGNGPRAVSVQLTSGTETRIVSVPFEIRSPFEISVAPANAVLVSGLAKSFTATFRRGPGFFSPISLSLVGAPAGLTANFGVHQGLGSTLNFTLAADGSVAPGTYPVTIRATGGGVVRFANLSLVVKRFRVTVNPDAMVLFPNSVQSLAVAIERGAGVTGPLTLATAIAPSGLGVGAAVLPTSTLGNSATINLSASRFAQEGTYSVTLEVSGAGATETVTIPLAVEGGSIFPSLP